jgi:hypothetical protein
MNIRPIGCDEDLQAAFRRLEAIFQAADGTPEADEHLVMEGDRAIAMGLLPTLRAMHLG